MTDAITAASAAGTTRTGAATQGLAENFELFLGLLTQQLRNQDPLDPLDSNQFVSQLVDFSSVEQLIAQNENLERLLAVQTASAGAVAVAYIGREAAVIGDAAQLADDRAAWTYALPQSAATVTARVRNEAGDVVREQSLGPQGAGPRDFVWDGLNASGQPAPDGVYHLEIAATNADGGAIPANIAGFARVTGVDFSADPPALIMSGARAALADVVTLREAV